MTRQQGYDTTRRHLAEGLEPAEARFEAVVEAVGSEVYTDETAAEYLEGVDEAIAEFAGRQFAHV